jgi:hypothetical protein
MDSQSEDSGYENTVLLKFQYSHFEDSSLCLYNIKLCDRKQKTSYANTKFCSLIIIQDIFKHNFIFIHSVTFIINTNWIDFKNSHLKCALYYKAPSVAVRIKICKKVYISVLLIYA